MIAPKTKPLSPGEAPAVLAEVERLHELETELETVCSELREYKPTEQFSPVEQAAEQFLAGKRDAALKTIAAPQTDRKFADLLARRDLLEAALRLQRERIKTTVTETSIGMSRAEEPRYKAVVQEMVRLVARLGELSDEEDAIRTRYASVVAGGRRTSVLRPCPLPELRGQFARSAGNQFLRRAREAYGFEP